MKKCENVGCSPFEAQKSRNFVVTVWHAASNMLIVLQSLRTRETCIFQREPLSRQSTTPRINYRSNVIDAFPSEIWSRNNKTIFDVFPLEKVRLMNSAEGETLQKCSVLIIVYNLFGETKHLLRSGRLHLPGPACHSHRREKNLLNLRN